MLCQRKEVPGHKRSAEQTKSGPEGVSAANNPGMTLAACEAGAKFVTPGSPRSLHQTIVAFPSALPTEGGPGASPG